MLSRHDCLKAAMVILAAVSAMWATTYLSEAIGLPDPPAYALGALGAFVAAILVSGAT